MGRGDEDDDDNTKQAHLVRPMTPIISKSFHAIVLVSHVACILNRNQRHRHGGSVTVHIYSPSLSLCRPGMLFYQPLHYAFVA